MKSNVHIGIEIRKWLNEQNLSVKWLAEEIDYDNSNLGKLLNKPYIHSKLLYSISVALGKDFFALYSKALFEEMK